MKNKDINVAIVGIGNCAKNFVEFVLNKEDVVYGIASDKAIVGKNIIGGYSRKNIKIKLAYDVNTTKVSKVLTKAIYQIPNCSVDIANNLKRSSVIVRRAPTLDGLGSNLKLQIRNSIEREPTQNEVVKKLKEEKIDVTVILLPTGAVKAMEWWINTCLKAKVSVINCTPNHLSAKEKCLIKFKKNNCCYIGDDMKSQIGATILHKTILELLEKQGLLLEHTSQINFGGNTDFLNLQERSKLKIKSKKSSLLNSLKTQHASSHIGLHYDETRGDRKRALIHIDGKIISAANFNIDILLDVEDSPNTVLIIFDAVRCIKAAMDKGIYGYMQAPSSKLMKKPKYVYSETEANSEYQEFISFLNS